MCHHNVTHAGIDDVIDALKGNDAGVSLRGVALGGTTPVCMPGKIERGKSIYCNDGKHGGCVILKTKKSVLIVVYNHNPDIAVRLAVEASEHLQVNGR